LPDAEELNREEAVPKRLEAIKLSKEFIDMMRRKSSKEKRHIVEL